MARFVAMRLAQAVLTLLGATMLIYFLVYSLPGDPVNALARGLPVPESVASAIRAQHHLNEPFLTQYWYYLSGLLQGDLGVDLNGVEVSRYLADAWPITLRLGLTAWVLTCVIGVVTGLLASVAPKPVASAILFIATSPMVIPSFVVALTTQLYLCVKLGWFPVAGTADGWPRSYLLPALVLAIYGLVTISRVTRAAFLANLTSEFAKTATAKGLPARVVILGHVLRSSLMPIITVLGMELGGLLSGAVFVEGIFNLPGIGQLIFMGTRSGNGPVVVGVGTLLVTIFIIVNLLTDLLYGIADPRTRRA